MSHKKTYLYNFNLYEMFRIDKYIKTVDSRLVVAYRQGERGMKNWYGVSYWSGENLPQ